MSIPKQLNQIAVAFSLAVPQFVEVLRVLMVAGQVGLGGVNVDGVTVAADFVGERRPGLEILQVEHVLAHDPAAFANAKLRGGRHQFHLRKPGRYFW